MSNKNIIIGHAITMNLNDISIFIATALQETDSDILLFVENVDIIPPQIIKTGRVFLQKSSWKKLTKKLNWHGLVNCRFVEYHNVLRTISQNNYYQHVLLTDTRDVLFQSDPFGKLDNVGIYFALEEFGVELGSSDDLFGLKRYLSIEECEFLRHKPLVCCGTIMGDIRSIADYLQRYVHIQSKFQNFRLDADDYAYDQGILNMVAHFDTIGHGLDIKLVECGALIATIGMTLRINRAKVTISRNRITYGSEVPAIVHQYDRLDNDCLAVLKSGIWNENIYSSLLHLP